MKKRKFILPRFFLRLFQCFLFITICTIGPRFSALANESKEDLTCSSYEAVYEPNLNDEVLASYKYSYQMYIQPTKNIRPGDPWSEFIFEVRDKPDKKLLTRLTMLHSCSTYCKTGYSYTVENGKEYTESFDIVGLDDNVQTQPEVVRPGDNTEQMAPKYIMFPTFARRVFYTPWKDIDSSDVEYFSEDKIFPSGFDVWRLESCIENTNTERKK